MFEQEQAANLQLLNAEAQGVAAALEREFRELGVTTAAGQAVFDAALKGQMLQQQIEAADTGDGGLIGGLLGTGFGVLTGDLQGSILGNALGIGGSAGAGLSTAASAGAFSSGAALGSAGLANIGAGAFLLSTQRAKDSIDPMPTTLEGIRRLNLERWRYKPKYGDEAEHYGPYAEEFAAAFDIGNGTEIHMADAFGVMLKAIQELAEKVERLEGDSDGAREMK